MPFIMQQWFSWPQDWGPKFGICRVFRKERGLYFGTKIGRVFGAKKHVGESAFLDRHGNTTVEWQHGKIEKARDGSMRNVVGVLGTPEAMRLL